MASVKFWRVLSRSPEKYGEMPYREEKQHYLVGGHRQRSCGAGSASCWLSNTGQDIWLLWFGHLWNGRKEPYLLNWSESHSVVSNSLQPHGLYSPWISLGQNPGMGSLSLLQGIFPTQGSNPGLPHCRWILYQLSHQGRPESLSKRTGKLEWRLSRGQAVPRWQLSQKCCKLTPCFRFFTWWDYGRQWVFWFPFINI